MQFGLPGGDESFKVEVTPEWAPFGAARFRELVETGFYDECRVFRVIKGFMAQFGLSGEPAVSAEWRAKPINDEPVTQKNLSMATSLSQRPARQTSRGRRSSSSPGAHFGILLVNLVAAVILNLAP